MGIPEPNIGMEAGMEMKSREDCAPKKPDAVQHFHNFSTAKLELTQLQAYTEYEVCVIAYNEAGDSEKCQVFKTLPDEAPGPVEELTSSTTSTSISLRWRKPCPPMAAISGYRVKVATVTHYIQASGCSDSAAHFCHTIKELQPERTYNIEVQSCTADAYRACSAATATAVTTEPAVSCTAEELQCGALCLPLSARCNGASERDDGEDELNCPGSCASNQFHCDDVCFPRKILCNGRTECDDGTDEANCAGGPKSRCDAPLCACSVPGMERVCLPCHELHNVTDTCHKLTNFLTSESGKPLCSVRKAAGVDINVLACGGQGLQLTCIQQMKVPVLTVVLAECWGSATLALSSVEKGLPAVIDSYFHLSCAVCGRKPRYYRKGRKLPLGDFRARRNLFPWLLGLKKRERYECSATLISDSWLLTAAHCVARSLESQNETMDPRDLKVQLTPDPRDDRYVTKIILNPDYKPGNIPLNDLALVMLEEPMIFSETMYPACIDLYGEGYLSSSTARRAGLHQKENKKLVGGSSGGPYMQNLGPDAEESWAVSGVVSASVDREGCDQPVTIYTAVHPFKEWIENVVESGQ
ncbi:enteropeptidase-like [Hyalella azteca]|uniref:Enteropeptidase-like n=1 Tax=Hyalella azteca TaxID=294128 RepID=A0A979FW91_HYAAZ|nr:enteropeptidase-like [Hyalella azteca]